MHARCCVSAELMKTAANRTQGSHAAEKQLKIAAFLVPKLLLLGVRKLFLLQTTIMYHMEQQPLVTTNLLKRCAKTYTRVKLLVCHG